MIATPGAAQEWRKAWFTVDGERAYPGYTRGDTWNGFACPFFEREIADRIAADFNADPYEKEGGGRAWFDAASDAFFYHARDDVDDDGTEWKPEPMTGQDAEIDGKAVHVYCIGGWEWTWGEVGR